MRAILDLKENQSMEFENIEYFDMPKLLRQADLQIRKFAASSQSTTVGEYYSMLSELLRLEPDVERALFKFIMRDADIDDCKSLSSMITQLENMGVTAFVIEFHKLLNAYTKMGNWREASAHAKQIKEDFNRFYLLLQAAKLSKKPDSLPGAALTLDGYIRSLDFEEANRKLMILVVDDSSVILHSLSAVLSREYKVVTLSKPAQLESVLLKLTPDLFLLDYKMPEISGFHLVPVIRGFDEHWETPIIFLTSEGTIDTVTAAMALGACDFIVKPFNKDVLREKIAKHIVRKKLF